MTRAWFTPWGWIYRPSSWQAAALTLMAFVFCVRVFAAIDRHSHSVSDTLYGIFPFVAPCFMLLNWVASKTSGTAKGTRVARRSSNILEL